MCSLGLYQHTEELYLLSVSVCVSGPAVLQYSTTHGRTLTGMEADMSPMWQAGMAPTAAPSQLRLILPCHDRLVGLPFTAHELGGGGVGGTGPTRHWLHYVCPVQ